MAAIEERYISLLTDFGFKRIFGTKPNKDLLINFLNSLFDGRQVVKDLMYLNGENIGEVYADRKAIFDVYCENEHGEKFIVEMQNAYQKFFKDRSLFYTTFPIRDQASKGASWDFRLTHVYTIAILNYDINEPSFCADKQVHNVSLRDSDTKEVFYDKLDFYYVEVSKFNKSADELVTMFDKWQYVLKNLSFLDKRPKALQEKIFSRLFSEASIARFTPSELKEYEDSKKAYRDIKNSIDTAREEGREEGRAEGREEGLKEGFISTAKNLLSLNIDTATIMKATGLTEEEINKLR